MNVNIVHPYSKGGTEQSKLIKQLLTHDPVEPHRLSLFPKIFWHCDRQETDAAGCILPMKLSTRSKVILHHTVQVLTSKSSLNFPIVRSNPNRVRTL